MLCKTISFPKALLSSVRITGVLLSNHIQFLKGSQWTTENPFWDYFLFESSTSYFLLLECAVSPQCEARAGSGSAWLAPAAELHSPPSCDATSSSLQLTHIFHLFLWSLFLEQEKKKVLGAIFHKTWGGNAVSLGEGQGSHLTGTRRQGVGGSPPVPPPRSCLRLDTGQGTNGVYTMTQHHLAFSWTVRFWASYLSSLSLGSLSSANVSNTSAVR